MKQLIPFLVLGFGLLVGGCSGGAADDGISSAEKQSATRLDDIAKKSGGDWSKVSQADRDFIVNDLSMGSEVSAKKLLEGKAGKLNASPGGNQTNK